MVGQNRVESFAPAWSNAINAHPDIAPLEKVDGRIERGLRRQSVLLDAARDLLIENGYRGTTLEAIIARAGGSRVTIYRAFGGKSGLVSAIIEQSAAELSQSVMSPSALKRPLRDGLMRFGLQLVATWQSEAGRAINRAVVSEGLDAPELLAAWYRSGFEPSITALGAYFDAQSAAGQLRPLDTRLAARQFIFLLIGELAFPMIAGEPALKDPRVQVQRCIDLVVAAYELAAAPAQPKASAAGPQAARRVAAVEGSDGPSAARRKAR